MPPTLFWPIPLTTPKSVFGDPLHHYASATIDHQVAIIPPFVYFGIWNVHWIIQYNIYVFLKKSRKKRNVSLGLNLWIFSLWKLIFHQWIDTRISCQFWGCDLLLGIGLLSARLSIKSHKAVMIELGGRMSGTILKIFGAE